MKKVLFGLLAIVALHACKKDDTEPKTEDPETHVDEYLLSVLVRDVDSVRFRYNDDNTVKQFTQYSLVGGMNDSTRVVYANGRISKFVLIEDDGTATRTDMAFSYSGNNLVRVDYYGFGNNSNWQITDHDSLVYKDGVLVECHRMLGDFRSNFSKYTWDEGDLIRHEYYSVFINEVTLDYYDTYTYNDKPNPYKAVKGDFLFAFTRGNQTYLSKKELATWETFSGSSGAATGKVTYAYEYDGVSKAIRKVISSATDVQQGGSPQVVTSAYTFIKK